jgi:hypothetical protein
MTALPVSLLAQIGTRALKAGKPALELGDIVISRALDGSFVVVSSRVHSLATPTNSESDATAPTVTSKVTFSVLPESLLSRIGYQTLQAGGKAVTIDDTTISRDYNGNFVIQSSESEIDRVATKTAARKSRGARTVSTTTRFSYTFLCSLIWALLFI